MRTCKLLWPAFMAVLLLNDVCVAFTIDDTLTNIMFNVSHEFHFFYTRRQSTNHIFSFGLEELYSSNRHQDFRALSRQVVLQDSLAFLFLLTWEEKRRRKRKRLNIRISHINWKGHGNWEYRFQRVYLTRQLEYCRRCLERQLWSKVKESQCAKASGGIPAQRSACSSYTSFVILHVQAYICFYFPFLVSIEVNKSILLTLNKTKRRRGFFL